MERRLSFRGDANRRDSVTDDVSGTKGRRGSSLTATSEGEGRRSLRSLSPDISREQGRRVSIKDSAERRSFYEDDPNDSVRRGSFKGVRNGVEQSDHRKNSFHHEGSRSPIPTIDVEEPTSDEVMQREVSGSETDSDLETEFDLDKHAHSILYRKSISDIIPDAQSMPLLLTYHQMKTEDDGEKQRSCEESESEPELELPHERVKPPSDSGPRLSIGQGMFNLLVRRFSSATEDTVNLNRGRSPSQDKVIISSKSELGRSPASRSPNRSPMSKSPSDSITNLDRFQSPRDSITEKDIFWSPRGSLTDEDIATPGGTSNASPRATTPKQIIRSPRTPTPDQVSRSPRTRTPDLMSLSPRGPSPALIGKSPRGSFAKENRSPRGSFDETDSLRRRPSKSPRGSNADQVAMSPRGSFGERGDSFTERGQPDPSPRGSISKSPRGSISKSPRGSFSKSPRDSFIDEVSSKQPRRSITDRPISSRNSFSDQGTARKSSTGSAAVPQNSNPELLPENFEKPRGSLTSAVVSFLARRLSGSVPESLSNLDTSQQGQDPPHTNGKHTAFETTPVETTMTANIDTLDVPSAGENGKEQVQRKPIQDITTVTFCGCGFLGVYLVGAATYLKEHAPAILKGRLGGSSVGSLVAVCIACDIPLQALREGILATARLSRKHFFGTFNPLFSFEATLLKAIISSLPEDAHVTASGRVFLSLTRVSPIRNEIVSEFRSREELIEALVCSCFIPGLSGFTAPTFNNHWYIDGGLSNNNPLQGPETLSINAFSGDFDVRPEEREKDPLSAYLPKILGVTMTKTNLKKVYEALLPPPPEILDKYYYHGYSDAQKFAPVAGGSRRKSFLDNFFG